ncbi:MAG: hypothetical protein K2X82_33225, partial [Gemmataceae bacterium]|nr:hypothetical protein [Gemmataceae bacterium]
MSRTTVRIASAAALLAAAGVARAQPPVPGGVGGYGGVATPPAFSPYLNIVGGFGSPAFNYFGIVRPQVAGRQAVLGLEGAVANNRQAIANMEAGLAGGEFNMSPTGHSTMFLNTGGYFMSRGGAGRAGPGVGGGGRRTGNPA